MSDMSQFDPSTFLDATTTEKSERRPPLDPGDYTAVTGELKVRAWSSTKAEAKIKSGFAFDIPLSVEVPLDQQQLKKLPATINMTDGIMLELAPGGGIDYGIGKNGQLRKWREATGLNEAGQPFNPRMIAGRVVKVKIGHRLFEGEIFDEIQGVAKA